MRSAADLRSAARRAGMTLLELERVPAPGGAGWTWSARMRFTDPWAAARLLQILSDEDAGDPVVVAWALEISAAALEHAGLAGQGPTMTPEMRSVVGAAIAQNVQAQIRFIHEPHERFQSARDTMAAGAGDCDDHARLVYALGRAAGLPAKLVFFDEDNEPVHVVSQLGDGIGMRWAETTIGADFGEHPYAALERVGADASADPMTAPGVGFLGLDFVTPGDVASRKEQLNAAVAALDSDAVHCASIDARTLGAWDEFVAAWRGFMATEPSVFNAGGQGRQASDYAEQIREWQDRIGKACELSGPRVPEAKGDPIVSTVQAIAVVAVAGAAAWALSNTTRTIRVLRGAAA
jgi:hypothetical protein